jgi:hypothetical protein
MTFLSYSGARGQRGDTERQRAKGVAPNANIIFKF